MTATATLPGPVGTARTGLVSDVVRFSWVDGPGNRYTIFVQGCNLNCLACHNPHTIPLRTPRATDRTVADLVDDIATYAPFLGGVTVSGGEAMLQPGLIADLFGALLDNPVTARLTRFIDSAGNVDRAAWDRVTDVTDGVMLDLKALDDDVHRTLTGVPNGLVLASLDYLQALRLLAQVRLLIVPGHNDTADQLRRTGCYLAAHAPDVPVQITGFRPHGVRAAARGIPAPTAAEREQYTQWVAESVPRNLITVV